MAPAVGGATEQQQWHSRNGTTECGHINGDSNMRVSSSMETAAQWRQHQHGSSIHSNHSDNSMETATTCRSSNCSKQPQCDNKAAWQEHCFTAAAVRRRMATASMAAAARQQRQRRQQHGSNGKRAAVGKARATQQASAAARQHGRHSTHGSSGEKKTGDGSMAAAAAMATARHRQHDTSNGSSSRQAMTQQRQPHPKRQWDTAAMATWQLQQRRHQQWRS